MYLFVSQILTEDINTNVSNIVMVLILDGNPEHVAQTYKKTGIFGEEKKSDL